MCREYGWSRCGERAYGVRAARRGATLSMIGAIRVGMRPRLMTCKGAVNGKRFVSFVRSRLVPFLIPEDIVVMDNLNVHKSKEARRLIKEAGAQVLFLPTYTPEFNPIELWWADLKRQLRNCTATTVEAVRKQVNRIRSSVPIAKLSGWFSHCIKSNHIN
jgi:transposase